MLDDLKRFESSNLITCLLFSLSGNYKVQQTDGAHLLHVWKDSLITSPSIRYGVTCPFMFTRKATEERQREQSSVTVRSCRL